MLFLGPAFHTPRHTSPGSEGGGIPLPGIQSSHHRGALVVKQKKYAMTAFARRARRLAVEMESKSSSPGARRPWADHGRESECCGVWSNGDGTIDPGTTMRNARGKLGRAGPSPTTNNHALPLIFMVGVILGHFHGQLMLSSQLRVDTTVTPHFSTSEPEWTRRRHNGWDSIDIFYGSKDAFERSLPRDLEWFSQAGQDEMVVSLLKNKTGGYFLDLAANDATHLSNTYILERRFGWTGLCVEPNPMYWETLGFRDGCQVVAAVVGSTRMEQVYFRFNAGDHGGIAGTGFDNGPKFKSSSVMRYTVTLDEILTRFQAPHHIDYLSLDVEGAEEFIMKNFPFDRYHISIMTTERPSKSLQDLFAKRGFRKLVRLTRWGEILWAHESILDSLDMTILDRMDELKAAYAKKYAVHE